MEPKLFELNLYHYEKQCAQYLTMYTLAELSDPTHKKQISKHFVVDA